MKLATFRWLFVSLLAQLNHLEADVAGTGGLAGVVGQHSDLAVGQWLDSQHPVDQFVVFDRQAHISLSRSSSSMTTVGTKTVISVSHTLISGPKSTSSSFCWCSM